MSIAPSPSATGTLPDPNQAAKREITLISHSMLFYWWPIWLLGYVMALDHVLRGPPAGDRAGRSKLTVDKENRRQETRLPRSPCSEPTDAVRLTRRRPRPRHPATSEAFKTARFAEGLDGAGLLRRAAAHGGHHQRAAARAVVVPGALLLVVLAL